MIRGVNIQDRAAIPMNITMIYLRPLVLNNRYTPEYAGNSIAAEMKQFMNSSPPRFPVFKFRVT